MLSCSLHMQHVVTTRIILSTLNLITQFSQTLYSVALYGSLGLAFSSWLKYFAVVSHDFVLILLMQSFCAMSHIFLSAIPSKLSAWFPKNEECIISGVSIFCNNGGIILNFISLMAINNSSDLTNMSRDLKSFMLIVAIIATILALIIAASFKLESPKIPPSYYEALRRDNIIQSDSKTFLAALRVLLTNKNFVMLALGFGLQLGIFNGFSTLINSIILYYFPVGCEKSISMSRNRPICWQSHMRNFAKSFQMTESFYITRVRGENL